MFSHASISQIENLDAIFTSEKLEKLDKLVEAINNLTINISGYAFSTATKNDALGNLTSDPDTVTHNINGFFDQK